MPDHTTTTRYLRLDETPLGALRSCFDTSEVFRDTAHRAQRRPAHTLAFPSGVRDKSRWGLGLSPLSRHTDMSGHDRKARQGTGVLLPRLGRLGRRGLLRRRGRGARAVDRRCRLRARASRRGRGHSCGRVLAGLHPESGEQLPRILRSDRLPGFDVTFSAPKSVSVIWAVADPQTAERIRAAHERAVAAALCYLEREAAYTRLGTDGHTAERGSGLRRRRLSPPDEPRRRSPASHPRPRRQPAQYRRGPLAGARRPTPLSPREERRLPLPGPASPRALRRARALLPRGSPRRRRGRRRPRRDAAYLLPPPRRGRGAAECRGASSAKAAQVAALSTRKAKDRSLGGDDAAGRVARAGAGDAGSRSRRRFARGRVSRARCPSRGSSSRSSARSRQSARPSPAASCSRSSPPHTDREPPVDEIERLADRFLAREPVVELGAGAVRRRLETLCASEPIYTTREVLALEQRLVARAEAHAGRRLAVADRRAVEAALARDPLLGNDQRELVRRLATEGSRHGLRDRPRRRRQDAGACARFARRSRPRASR